LSELTADSPIEGSNPEPEAERPEWLPVNFNDPADLAKSWKDGQAAKTRAEQEAASLRSQLESIEAQQFEAQQQQQSYQQQNDLVARLDQAREIGDTQTELALMAYVAQQAAAQAVPQAPAQTLPAEFVADYASRAVAEKYDDWDSYKERAAQFLSQNSYLISDEVASNPQLLAQRLDLAYTQVKAADLLSGAAPAAAAAQQAEAQRQAKLDAQTLHGANGRPAPVTENPFQEVMNAKTMTVRDLFG
jgi:hypothetical protein